MSFPEGKAVAITLTPPTSHGLHLQAPAKRKLRARRMPFDPKAEPGAMEPLGYFDPLGLCPPGGWGWQYGFGPENVGLIFPMIASHLMGIMIMKTIGFRGLIYFQTHPYESGRSWNHSYPLGISRSHRKSLFLIGKRSINGQFSMAMLNNQMVYPMKSDE